MRSPTLRFWIDVALITALAACPSLAWGQVPGWYVIPSFSVTEEFDDNILSESSGRKSDFISRSSPGLKGGYQSTPLTLLGNYSFDAEVYVNNPELNNEATRQRAGLEFSYLPNPLLTLGLNATYTLTETPTELNVETGIEAGRRRASRVNIAPSINYQFTPLTAGGANYSFSRSEAREISNTTHRTDLTLSRRFTPKDTGTLGYTVSLFESDETDSTTSHASTVGWSRQFTELTSLTSKWGARVTEGAVGVETSSTLTHQFKLARVSIAYSRSEATVIGRRGTVETEALSGTIGIEPIQFLQVNLAPSVRKSTRGTRGETSDTTVYGLNASATYQIREWLNLRSTYRFSFQEGTREEISHNIFSITLDIIYPVRVY